jgi:hypothetical protein
MTKGQEGLEQLHRMATQIAITVVNNAKLAPDAPAPEGGAAGGTGGAPGGASGGAPGDGSPGDGSPGGGEPQGNA